MNFLRYLCVPLFLFSLAVLSCSGSTDPSEELENQINLDDVEDAGPIPVEIEQISPNPFDGTMLIRFRVKKKLFINLRISGESTLILLLSEVRDEGTHYYTFEAPPWMLPGRYRVLLEEIGRGRTVVAIADYTGGRSD